MVAHGWAAPAAVDPEREPAAEPVTRLVEGLAALPGAEYVLAVDAGGERVRGESGGPPGPAMAVIDWARHVADVSRERHQDLEDLVLTTDTAFHLVRLVTSRPGAARPDDRGPLWVAVRIDRERGNLARSRRALAGVGSPGSVTGPRAIGPAPEKSSAPPVGSASPERAVPGARTPASGGPATASMPAFTRPAATPGPAGRPPQVPDVPAPPVEPAPRAAPTRRSWFRPSASPESPPTEARRSWAARRPADQAPSSQSPSSWFSPSTAGSPWPSRPSDPAPSSREDPAPEIPAPAGPASGTIPAAMPGRAEDGPAVVPVPRDDATPAVRREHDRAITQLPPHERDLPGARRSDAQPPEKKGGRPSRRLPLTVREGVWWSGRSERPDSPELGPPTGPTPIVSPAGAAEPTVPAARTSAEDPPAPTVPAPRGTGLIRGAGSLFAPVVVVPPPPSPVPEDDTTEMPAPMPAPTITAAPLEVRPMPGPAPQASPAEAPDTEVPADEVSADEIPADEIPADEIPADEVPAEEAPADEVPADEAPGDGDAAGDEAPDLPQRRPGSHLPAGMPATPRSVPTVRPAAAVAGTAAFTTEPSVLRRLIDGLRRLS